MKNIFDEIEIDKKTFLVNINYKDLIIDKSEINSLLGYDEKDIPQHFSEIINSILHELPLILNIKAGYKIFDFVYYDNEPNGIFINNKFFYLHKIITKQIYKSEFVILFCLTIGTRAEKKINELFEKGDAVKGYIYDTILSLATETVANVLHEHIKKKFLKVNKKVTNRFSPGYCSWNVDEQKILFSLLPKNFCGIKLNKSSLMKPIKSISGIIGIGEKVKFREYNCNKCEIKDCTYRTILKRKSSKQLREK
ncbi:MAG: hypothetical protein N2321_11400 [Melioribacteraceae bacterium]|nr:hypothetical protein [Melioribacteraceae bacterium]